MKCLALVRLQLIQQRSRVDYVAFRLVPQSVAVLGFRTKHGTAVARCEVVGRDTFTQLKLWAR